MTKRKALPCLFCGKNSEPVDNLCAAHAESVRLYHERETKMNDESKAKLDASVAELEAAVASNERAVTAMEERFRAIAERLRETARDLRAGKMNIHHCANRLDKIANEIAKGE